jgi:hypothetical protein
VYNYVTLDEIKRTFNISGSTDDAALVLFASWATALIDEWKGRRYDVRYETRLYDTPETPSSSFGSLNGAYATGNQQKLRLSNDLVELVELVNRDEIALESGDFVLEPANETPKTRIKLRNGAIWVEGEYGPEQAISVTGFWGAHDRYQDAWKNSQVLAAELDDSAVEIDLSSLGTLQAGQLLRIDDELILLESIVEKTVGEVTTYTLTVERGFNGSTAAVHNAGAQIKIFKPMGIIQQAAMRLVKWRYAQRDVDNFDKTYIVGTGTVSIPANMPSDVVLALGSRGRAS